ncbi:SDR family oxidoreductase [Atopomonas sediminilitoris]|uniref:SDR family oxidoreductase n=1 Tax=Atopomonas sediminilitoris TaxID=2919919 RepID=UPI001F4E5708|nr:SDR family oxidoreductase [Atopomonas sediminilitoris]MCJ8170154.1 SDR family oxidoreductase [Atopomonas sediminilitoris]
MSSCKAGQSSGWTPQLMGSLVGKTYVITGASAGAGFEAARLLLSKGARVVMLNRSEEKSLEVMARLQPIAGSAADISFISMDLSSLDSVRAAAAKLLAAQPRIDALLCNAAIAQVAKHETTRDGFESQWGVNHLGHFLLCGLLFERIAASAGRVVVVGSNAYKMGLKRIQFEDINFQRQYSAWNAYAQSKLAQMMFAYELQRRVSAADKSVQVLVCHPGASRTNLLKDTASPFNKALWAVLSRVMAQSAEKGSWPEVMCATHAGLKPEGYYGPTRRAQMVGPVGECPLDAVAHNRVMAAQLWQLSEQQVGFCWPL